MRIMYSIEASSLERFSLQLQFTVICDVYKTEGILDE